MAEGDPEEFILKMDEFTKITWGKINNFIKGITTNLFMQIIMDTPVDNGWTKNSWFFSLDNPSDETIPEFSGDKKVQYEKTGKAKANNIANKVKRAAGMTNKGELAHTYYLTNNAKPASMLEYGRYPWENSAKVVNGFSTQAPQGFVRKNLQTAENVAQMKYAIYTAGSES